MTQWWNEMPSFQQVLFVIACATTLFMIVQIILLAVGSGDNDSSYDSDTSVDGTDSINDGGTGLSFFGLRIFTVRGLVAFFAIGSWLTFALFYGISYWAIIPGVAAGFAAMVGISFFIKSIEKLQNDGTLHFKNSIGKSADVYLTIPANRESSGKINAYVQERYVEMAAITDDDEPIRTGAKVKIVEAIGEGLVRVERLIAEKPVLNEVKTEMNPEESK